MLGDWRDLSDAELRAKLRRARVPLDVIGTMVSSRDEPEALRWISGVTPEGI